MCGMRVETKFLRLKIPVTIGSPLGFIAFPPEGVLLQTGDDG
jgi:hypothetical protein